MYKIKLPVNNGSRDLYLQTLRKNDIHVYKAKLTGHWHLSFKVLVSENSLDINYTTVSSYPYMYII